MKQDMIVILDLGSTENTVLAREIRELGVYSEIHPHDITEEEIKALDNVKGIILNGGENRVVDGKEVEVRPELYTWGYPVISVDYPASRCDVRFDSLPDQETLKKFVFDECKAEANWNMKNFIEDQVELICRQVGDRKVLLALSGGVDSSVVAAMLIKAIGQQLVCVHVNHGLMRKGESEQVIEVFRNQMNANLEWKKAQNGKEPELIAHISKLFIPSSARDAAEKSKPVQIQGGWPAINAVIDDLTYGNMRLGKLELVARNTPSTKGQLWKITKLNLSNSAAQLRSSGSWLKGFDGGNETNLLINTNINNLGGLLNRLDMQNLVRSGNGSISGNLSWVGTPLGFNTESFDGELDINLRRGEILKIQPGPAAKLLSLLTLQSLTRYLTLDFRDFYSAGFNFSAIRGKAVLDDGLMNIKDLTMIGGSATVVINGNVNTQKETEDLHLLVLPDINAAGASVALAVANPIVGIGSFLAQLIFKDPLSKLFSFEYQVTGTWSDPVVTKIKH